MVVAPASTSRNADADWAHVDWAVRQDGNNDAAVRCERVKEFSLPSSDAPFWKPNATSPGRFLLPSRRRWRVDHTSASAEANDGGVPVIDVAALRPDAQQVELVAEVGTASAAEPAGLGRGWAGGPRESSPSAGSDYFAYILGSPELAG
jgi:hypothetical protein